MTEASGAREPENDYRESNKDTSQPEDDRRQPDASSIRCWRIRRRIEGNQKKIQANQADDPSGQSGPSRPARDDAEARASTYGRRPRRRRCHAISIRFAAGPTMKSE